MNSGTIIKNSYDQITCITMSSSRRQHR